MRFSFLFFIALIVAMTGYSCKKKGGKLLDQGEIHYNIEYNGDLGSIPKELLPKNLIVSFKDNKSLFEMTSPFGNSGILNLSNPEDGIFDTYFSLFTLKYFYAAEPGETFPGLESMKEMEIKNTSKTSVICGFNCKNAEVIFPGTDKVYEIWYTDEIDVKGTNASTPYKEIEGVLMDFYFFLGSAELRFSAETVYQKEISDETFQRRTQFQRISREDINRLIGKMVNI